MVFIPFVRAWESLDFSWFRKESSCYRISRKTTISCSPSVTFPFCSIFSVPHYIEKDMQATWHHSMAFSKDQEGRALIKETPTCYRFSARRRGCYSTQLLLHQLPRTKFSEYTRNQLLGHIKDGWSFEAIAHSTWRQLVKPCNHNFKISFFFLQS